MMLVAAVLLLAGGISPSAEPNDSSRAVRDVKAAVIPCKDLIDDGLYVSHAGTSREEARALLCASRGKSHLPEPLRLAHLIGGAIAAGESRGRP